MSVVVGSAVTEGAADEEADEKMARVLREAQAYHLATAKEVSKELPQEEVEHFQTFLVNAVPEECVETPNVEMDQALPFIRNMRMELVQAPSSVREPCGMRVPFVPPFVVRVSVEHAAPLDCTVTVRCCALRVEEAFNVRSWQPSQHRRSDELTADVVRRRLPLHPRKAVHEEGTTAGSLLHSCVDFAFEGLAFAKSTQMQARYLIFTCETSTWTFMATLYHFPTLALSRRRQQFPRAQQVLHHPAFAAPQRRAVRPRPLGHRRTSPAAVRQLEGAPTTCNHSHNNHDDGEVEEEEEEEEEHLHHVHHLHPCEPRPCNSDSSHLSATTTTVTATRKRGHRAESCGRHSEQLDGVAPTELALHGLAAMSMRSADDTTPVSMESFQHSVVVEYGRHPGLKRQLSPEDLIGLWTRARSMAEEAEGSHQISYMAWRTFYCRFKECMGMLMAVKDAWNKLEPSLIHGFHCGMSMSYSRNHDEGILCAPDVDDLLAEHPPGTFVVWIGHEMNTIVLSCVEDATHTHNPHPSPEDVCAGCSSVIPACEFVVPLEDDGTDEANEMGACADGTYVRHAVLDYNDVMVRRFETWVKSFHGLHHVLLGDGTYMEKEEAFRSRYQRLRLGFGMDSPAVSITDL